MSAGSANRRLELLRYMLWRFHRAVYREVAPRLDRKPEHPARSRFSRLFGRDCIPGWPGEEAIITHFRERTTPTFFFEANDLPAITAMLAETEDRDIIGSTIEVADRASVGRFEVLGRGSMDFGLAPDWHRDVLTGKTWPFVHHTMLDYIDPDSGTDVRLTWEVNRCHHFVTLGQAYQYTGNSDYADAFSRQLKHWCQVNPPYWGINWTVAMEAAIRSVNWIWAYYLFRRADEVDDETWRLFLSQLSAHGDFIYKNLELSRVPGNHYLANGTGLVYLGLLFPEFRSSKRWLKKGLEILWTEIPRQTCSDGGNFEGTPGYHRLVADLVTTPVILCQRNGVRVPETVLKVVESMYDFVLGYMKPDGTAPGFGDSDDGRLLRLAPRSMRDHRPLLGTGAVLFDRPDFNAAAGRDLAEAIWIWGAKAVRHAPFSSPQTSCCFPDTGLYIMRDHALYLAIQAGFAGRSGRGAHAHNDCLSLELSAHGVDFIVDSGTFVYTASFSTRRRFQGTGAHNVVMVDGEEMAGWKEGQFWGLAEDVRPLVKRWTSNQEYDVFVGEHYGYTRLPWPVVHSRRVIFDRRQGFWVLEDVIDGQGHHLCEFRLYVSPDTVARVDETNHTVQVDHKGGARLLIIPLQAGSLTPILGRAQVSPTYGAVQETAVISYIGEGEVPLRFRFVLVPFTGQQKADVEVLRTLGVRLLGLLNRDGITS